MEDSVLSFIEEIVSKYELEKDLIEGDLLLKKKIQETTDISEIPIVKILYSEKVKERLDSGIPLEEVIPSIKLKNIINQIIKKEISYGELSKIIEEKLKIDKTVAEEISNLIQKNKEISQEMLTYSPKQQTEADDPEEETVKNPSAENKKTIGHQLLE